jgi:hypothetical protein
MSALPSDALQKPPLEQKSAGFLAFGTEFVNPNFADMGEAVGVRGIRSRIPTMSKPASPPRWISRRPTCGVRSLTPEGRSSWT